jgi:hypothetical protein
MEYYTRFRKESVDSNFQENSRINYTRSVRNAQYIHDNKHNGVCVKCNVWLVIAKIDYIYGRGCVHLDAPISSDILTAELPTCIIGDP